MGHTTYVAMASMVGLLAVACGAGASADLTRRLNDANDKAVACGREVNQLKTELSALKKQLAAAIANPAKVVLTDPEILNLIADLRAAPPPEGEELTIGKGDLDPAAASRVIRQGATAMQQCYERALKKNAGLQYQVGTALTMDVTVHPAGVVQTVDVTPILDREMNTCMETAAKRWKFPKFGGKPVTVSQKLTLTPKT